MEFLFYTIIKAIGTELGLLTEAESQAPDSDGCVAPQEEAQPGTLHGAVAVDTCSSTLDGVSDVAPADSASSVAAKEETTSGTVEIYPASDDEAPPEGARTSATVEIAPVDSAYDVPAKEETTLATAGGAPADSASNVAAVGDTTSGTVCGTAWAAAWSDPAGYGGWFIPHMISHRYFRREKPSDNFQHIGTLYIMQDGPVAFNYNGSKKVTPWHGEWFVANEFHAMKIFFDTDAANNAWNKDLWIYIHFMGCCPKYMCGMDNEGREVYTVKQMSF